MTAWLRLFWQQIQKHRVLAPVILAVLIAGIAFAIAVWRFSWDWTGFGGYNPNTHPKTFRDWLQLLIIPSVLAGGALWFNRQQSKASEQENKDNQREEALQAYIESMSELLLEKKLRNSKPEDEVRTIARVRTLAVLPRLDRVRKWSVLHFLRKAGLINKNLPIIDLDCADFSEADLRGINLHRSNLCAADTSQELGLYEGVHLEKADLSHAKLDGANLFMAQLQSANLRWASLEGTYLSNADL